MKKISLISLFLIFSSLLSISEIFAQLKAPGVKWENSYSFDVCNTFEVLFFTKNSELMRKLYYVTHYQTNGKNFSVKRNNNKKTTEFETVFDLKNEVAIQIWGSGTDAYYNAGGFKYPAGNDIKQLQLLPTSETKKILSYACKKYTFTYKKITGEVWIADQMQLSNDVGIFRAAKMASLHNTLSVDGFVLEMTIKDTKGGMTMMNTTALKQKENYKVSFENVDMNTAINKINYYTF